MKQFRQDGLTLLEILIALLVLSLGMVGLGALLLTALTNVHSASQYSLASAIALDFEERLWHEVAAVSADDPNELDANGCLTNDHLEAVVKEMTDRWTEDGTYGGWDWTDAERFRSPGLEVDLGEVEVTTGSVDATPTGINLQTMQVTIRWTEGRFELADDAEEYSIDVAIVCRPVFN